MPAYSLDFRHKVVSTYNAGNTSIRQVAQRFILTPRTVHRWVCQYRETGSLQPRKPGNPTPSPLEAHAQDILDLVASHSDWTLSQYCEVIGEETGVYISPASLCHFFQRHQITLKKRPTAIKR